MECTNCGDPTGVLIALAALLISAASLYLSALRRPRLEVDHFDHPKRFLFAREHTGAMPGPVMLELDFAISNTGASATVLQGFALADFRRFPCI